ncbi:MAG: PKD domain-containing protein, partial [Dehalococcoidales bacterium]|nr:PKD domain-containing protein [Dehalococcoidales bacterium]
MKKVSYILLTFILLIGSMIPMTKPVSAAEQTSISYGDYSGSANWFSTHFADFFGGEETVPVWDLTQGDLVLNYTLDMSRITQPHGLSDNLTEWEVYTGSTEKDPENYPDSYTPYIEMGLRGEGAGDFNPGPFGVYQGNCGGWMVSECDDWVGYWDGDTFVGDGTVVQDLDDKHGLQASGGRSELDYDVLLSTPDTVDSIPSPYPWYPSPKGVYGSWENHGLWFDRDGVDEWQAVSWANSGENAGRINTAGIYNIEIRYHAIDANGNGDKTDDGLGVMFAAINGVQQGFYTTWVEGPPQFYPVGLSFKGDMEHMQVFAGSWAGDPPGWDYGMVHLTNISVTGYPGVSDPMTADFNYTVLSPGDTVQFNDLTSGGMPPYTYLWKFGDGGESTDQNPTHVYDAAGDYTVELTVTPFRCVPKTITKTLSLGETDNTDNTDNGIDNVTIGTGGGVIPAVKCKWEQQPVAVEPTMEDADQSHIEPGFQVLPPLVAGAKKMIEYYAVVTDEEDGGSLAQVFADVYHPVGSPEPYGPSVTGGISDAPYFKYEVPFVKLGHSAAEIAMVQAAYDADLITFGAFTLEDVL